MERNVVVARKVNVPILCGNRAPLVVVAFVDTKGRMVCATSNCAGELDKKDILSDGIHLLSRALHDSRKKVIPHKMFATRTVPSSSLCCRALSSSSQNRRFHLRREMTTTTMMREQRPRVVRTTQASNDEDASSSSSIKTTSNPALKAAWFASEQFGKAIGGGKSNSSATVLEKQEENVMTTRAETIDSLAKDYEKNYFIGGESEMKAYSSSCVFADPFVSFTGLDRFKQNVGNLGTSLRDVECKVLKTVDNGVGGVIFYWKFSAVVDALPWRPKLAASGNTTHVLDDANKVVKHIEAWDVDPWVVLKKLLVPASKLPENKWELGMLAVSQRDGFGALQAISEPGVKLFAALFVLEKLPGVNLGGFEAFTSLMLVATAVTEFWALLISFGVVKK